VTANLIQEKLEELSRDRTTIIISHQLSTLLKADQLLVLNNGRIIEMGTHDNLLKANGHYALMWNMQVNGELPTIINENDKQ
jgi:ABC-type multidrug transport system fused ATPase/permease subunit